MPTYVKRERPFRPVSRIAFYADGAILRHVPAIRGIVESVSLGDEGYTDIDLADLEPLVHEQARKILARILEIDRARFEALDRSHFKLMLLSGPDDPDTFVLNGEVVNDKLAHSGRPTDFVQGQRYVSFAKLQMHPKVTSELESDARHGKRDRSRQ